MKIFLSVCGSIAAYKSVDFLRALRKAGHEVELCLSESAKNFVGITSLETFLGKKIISNSLFDSEKIGTHHIEIAKWADLCLIFGATANTLAKISHGFADDFISTQILASRAPLLIAPAMNTQMWEAAATQENVKTIVKRGALMIGPIAGQLACGDVGVGHIADFDEIIDAISQIQTLKNLPNLRGKKILLSLGAMSTSIDPARRISNSSSGKSGLEFARALRSAGADVTILCGLVSKEVESALHSFVCHKFEDSKSYSTQLQQLSKFADVIIANAAVLDFDVQTFPRKLSRSEVSQSTHLQIPIQPVEDFVQKLQQTILPHQKIIAFGLEDGDVGEVLEKAKAKLFKKGTFALVANRFTEQSGPNTENNEYWILNQQNEEVIHVPNLSKSEAAKKLVIALNELSSFS